MKAIARLTVGTLALAGSALQAQTIVTPGNLNGWILYDGASGTSPAAITAAQPFNGNGSLQYNVNASNQQPSAAFVFANPVALSQLQNLSLGYSFLTPAGSTPAASPTIRLLLTGLSGVTQPGTRTDGSLGWYLNGSSNAWQTQSFSAAVGDFFFRVGGVGQEALDCKSTGSSFDDRRQTIGAWLSACNGTGGAANLVNAFVVGVQVDWGTFANQGPATGYADMVNFSIGPNEGNYNFEVSSNVVPEPASMSLLGLGLVGVGAMARKRKQQA